MLVLVKGGDVKSVAKATLVMAGSKIWQKEMIILTAPVHAYVFLFGIFFYLLRLIYLGF